MSICRMSAGREDKMTVKLDLAGQTLRRFLEVKARYGLENNPDVLRLLITRAYDELVEKVEKPPKRV